MDPLVARMRRTVRRFSLMRPGARVLVAVSGGADSMALLHALHDLQGMGEASIAGIAHLNHGLRGEAADQDEAFCRSVAAGLRVPFDCERIDVRALAAHRRLSLEAAGHQARYEFFERAAERANAERVALGHTRDDQAETFLLRLLRGAGPRGLGGMHPGNGRIIRPMLDCSRRQVRAFVVERGIAFREDATNADVAIPRNLIRHDLLPRLADVVPGVVRVLSREAAIARDDAEFLDAAARTAFGVVVRVRDGAVEIDAPALHAAPRAVARRVAAAALSVLAGPRFVGFEQIERLRELAGEVPQGAMCRLPGQVAERVDEVVVLRREAPTPEILLRGTNSFQFSLSIPGEVVTRLGWTVSAERWTLDLECTGAVRAGGVPRSWAVLDSAAVQPPLEVRNWRPGDRFRPLGMAGTRKLQDFFVDRKVPRARRAQIPIVVDPADRVVWVAGHAIAEDFRVTPATSDVVILKLKYWRDGT